MQSYEIYLSPEGADKHVLEEIANELEMIPHEWIKAPWDDKTDLYVPSVYLEPDKHEHFLSAMLCLGDHMAHVPLTYELMDIGPTFYADLGSAVYYGQDTEVIVYAIV